MGKSSDSRKQPPKSKVSHTKHKIEKKVNQAKTAPTQDKLSKEEQTHLIAIYTYLKTHVRSSAFVETLSTFKNEIEALLNGDLVEESAVVVQFESNKMRMKSIADELAKQAAEAAAKAEEAAKLAAMSSSSESSSSSSSSDDSNSPNLKIENVMKKNVEDVPSSSASDSSSESSSSSDSSSESDSDSDNDEQEEKAGEEEKRLAKKQKTNFNENDVEVSDTDVSDVEVSDVSSVETSSDEESESEKEDSSSDSSSDSDSSASDSDSDSDNSSTSSSDEENNLVLIKAKKAEMAKKKAAEAAAAAASWMPTPPKASVEIKTEKGTDGAQALSKGTPFKRVDDQFWGEVAWKAGGAMADNSYEGAFGENGFGARASAKLLQVQGKRFQHEKTKAKRSYNGFAKTGQGITMESFSSKFKYDD